MNRFRTPVFLLTILSFLFFSHRAFYGQSVSDQIARSLKLIEIGNAKQALTNLQSLANTNPKNADAQAAYAIAIIENQKSLSDAEATLNTAYDIEHKSVLVRTARGMLFGKQGKREDAVKEFRQAIKYDDKNVSTYLSLARFYISVDSLKSAEITLYQAQAVNANDVHSYIGLAELYERQHATQLAIEQYQSAEKLDPKDVTVQAKLAGLYFRNRKYDESINEWIKITKIDSSYSRAYYEIARIFFWARQYGNAATYAEKYTTLESNDMDGIWLAAQSLSANNQYQKALPYLEKAAKDDSLKAYVPLYLAKSYYSSKEFAKADSMFSQVKNLGPEDMTIWGYTLVSKGDTAAGVAKMNQSFIGDTVRSKEEKIKLYGLIISLLHAEHKYGDEAKEYITENSLDNSLDDLINAGQLFTFASMPDDARATFNSVLQKDPKNVNALVGLGDVSMGSDSTIGEAEKYIDQAAALASTTKQKDAVGEAYARLGIKYYTFKKFEKCATMLEANHAQKYLSSSSPYLVKVYNVLAIDYLQLKKLDKADENYKKVLTIDPKNEDAKKGLEYIKATKGKK
ncbi:MAG TPA: tetratricopeptide repeat protein [Candidatus Kapabacteria bacterium]|nr:tetratricopeptide repeat protein [Candidatus Kapabacteria bacterium]